MPEKPPQSPRDAMPFDPHSVPSVVTVEQQKQQEEFRKHLATAGVISAESVPEEGGIDIHGIRIPQYAPRNMQKDIDALEKGKETEKQSDI